MPTKLRLASFNIENLFSRAKILNLRSRTVVDDKLKLAGDLNRLIQKTNPFTAADKARIVALYDELNAYICIRENRGKKLFDRAKTTVVASSGTDWDGELEFKRENFPEVQRQNTPEVIKATKADIACIVEAENRPTLKALDSEMLNQQTNGAIPAESEFSTSDSLDQWCIGSRRRVGGIRNLKLNRPSDSSH